MLKNPAIDKAISIAGGQRSLARLIGVRQSAVHKWLYGGGIKSKCLPMIVEATRGEVTIESLIQGISPR